MMAPSMQSSVPNSLARPKGSRKITSQIGVSGERKAAIRCVRIDWGMGTGRVTTGMRRKGVVTITQVLYAGLLRFGWENLSSFPRKREPSVFRALVEIQRRWVLGSARQRAGGTGNDDKIRVNAPWTRRSPDYTTLRKSCSAALNVWLGRIAALTLSMSGR